MKPTNRKTRWLPLILALATLMALLLVACTEGGTEGTEGIEGTEGTEGTEGAEGAEGGADVDEGVATE